MGFRPMCGVESVPRYLRWLFCFGRAWIASPDGGEGSGGQHWRVTLTGTWWCRGHTGGSFGRASCWHLGETLLALGGVSQLGFGCHWEELLELLPMSVIQMGRNKLRDPRGYFSYCWLVPGGLSGWVLAPVLLYVVGSDVF